MEENKKDEKIYTIECVHCKHMIDCEGKPKTAERCINYEQR